MLEIFIEATRADALTAFETFVIAYKAKYLKAVEKLKQDRDSLLQFYDFSVKRWQHIRSTNPI